MLFQPPRHMDAACADVQRADASWLTVRAQLDVMHVPCRSTAANLAVHLKTLKSHGSDQRAGNGPGMRRRIQRRRRSQQCGCDTLPDARRSSSELCRKAMLCMAAFSADALRTLLLLGERVTSRPTRCQSAHCCAAVVVLCSRLQQRV